MILFKHFLITLFNVRLWDVDKKNNPTRTDEWMEDRFDMFEKFCLPSVAAQSNRNFIWICLFDSETPQKYIDRINSFRERVPMLTPCLTDIVGREALVPAINEIISGYVSPDDRYVITTNLDNDDAIRYDMIERLQSLIGEDSANKIYSLNLGYQYFASMKLAIKMKYPHNHFLTLVEPAGQEYKTILGFSHVKARKLYTPVDIMETPYWIEFVHGNNVNNDIRITSRIKYYPIFRSVDFGGFGLNISLTGRRNTFNSLVRFPAIWLCRLFNRINRKIRKLAQKS